MTVVAGGEMNYSIGRIGGRRLIFKSIPFFIHWNYFAMHVYPNKSPITYRSLEGHKDILKKRLQKLKGKEIKYHYELLL